MAEDLCLPVEKRSDLGSVKSSRLRKLGRVPGNLYGFGKDNVSITLSAEDVEKLVAGGSRVVDVQLDGGKEKAVVQELQWDVFSTHVQHVDLMRVDPASETTVDVPLEIRGEPIGLKDGGQLRQLETAVTVTCPSFRVPRSITVRVGALRVGDSVKVSDLKAPDEVTITTPGETVVVELFDPKKQ
ncbi:MAG: 50S ribosomal protein L25 [Planctomycetaceae bacterium]|nr:50S ribosomal protein L25 [Planctomycetaceae bacterium]